ncbi:MULTISPECIES: hypothetical protein [Priestia]|uniref:hypothetical protein n=1 Tax=Priestia TaxID=2800373 RepID=UPI001C8DD27B|nr:MULTISPECIES: hypothetical protein [Priestia]MBY0064295.1 hypothetical protein [Priestia aryabhattai]MDN3363899.1 hypothetical protein [Priestia megaterium]WKU25183.1 hypothetical protein Q3A90_10085 [Priestia megaterium]
MSKRFLLTVAAGGGIIIFGALVLLNWEKMFGDYRPIQTAKAVFKLEVGSQDVAETTDSDDALHYMVKKGHLDEYIHMMNEKGYVLKEKDIDHNRLVFNDGQEDEQIYYKRFARKYTMIDGEG